MTYCRPEKYNVLIDASIVTETRGRDSSKKANHKPQYRKEGKHESRQWDGKKGKGGRGGILCIVGGGLGRASRAFLGHSRVEGGGERGRDVRGNCWRPVYEVEPSRLTRVREKEGVEEKDGRLG